MKKPRMGLLLGSAVALIFGLGYVLNQSSYEADIPDTSVATPRAEASPTPAPSKEATRSQSPPSTPTPAPQAATTAAQTRIEHPDFQKLIADAKQTIPTKSDLKKLTAEEVHFTPVSIQKAAVAIGSVSQAAFDHYEYHREAVSFFRDCAENPDYPDSIAATCLAKFRDTVTHDPSLHDESVPKASPTATRLADKLGHL